MEIKVVRQVLEWNEDCSQEIKKTLKEKQVCLINVMGSPGAGKTSLIIELVKRLSPKWRAAVLEGDIAGQIDAKKIGDMGIPVVQLNTDGACHIEAMSVQHILPMFALEEIDILFVENIGNLVCPAEFNIGENFRIALLSIPEGDDKVEKYPLMFATTDGLILNKYDMLPYFDFNDKQVEQAARDMNPAIELFRVSSRTGEGMDALVGWLAEKITKELEKE